MRISDWSSDVCSSDLHRFVAAGVDVAADGLVDLDRLEHADAALESGAAARLAALGTPDDGADVEPEHRRDAVVGLDGFAAIVAKFAHKALRKDGAEDRKSTRLNSSHSCATRMPSSA